MKVVKKVLMALLIVPLLGLTVFVLGPKPKFEKVNNAPLEQQYDLANLDKLIAKKEALITNLKPDNEARIVWADSSRKKTAYSIVYIHGFSASQGEGFPIHLQIADSLKANLYLARLRDHGVQDKEVFRYLTPAQLMDDAKQAIAIGKVLGDTLIVMSCSTGSTLAIYLAANDPDISSLIMLSPNISIKNKTAKMLTGSWGRQLAHKLVGEYRLLDSTQSYKAYWTNEYHVEGLIALQALIDQTMTRDIFSKIQLPVYVGYYYRNEKEQDQVVSVDAMLKFKSAISTPPSMIEFDAFPEAGNHVIGSSYKTSDWPQVRDEILTFIHNIYKE